MVYQSFSFIKYFTFLLILSHGVSLEAFSQSSNLPMCLHASSDSDGDGWGWENEESCIVEGSSDRRVAGECTDPDGDGWGWNGVETCLPESSEEGSGDEREVEEATEEPESETISSEEELFDEADEPISAEPEISETYNRALSCEEEQIETAMGYEELFFNHLDKLGENIDKMGRISVKPENRSWNPNGDIDLAWTFNLSKSIYEGDGQRYGRGENTIYGGLTGQNLYHLLDELSATSRMLKLAHQYKPEHVETYQNFLIDFIDEFTPALLEARGTQHCLNYRNDAGIYKCHKGKYHRFLDGSRALSWLGLTMESVLETGSGSEFEQKFAQNARDLRPLIDRFISQSTKDVSPPHMRAHPAFAAYTLGRMGGYLSEYREPICAVVKIMTDNISGPTKWIGSDAGHAEDTVSFLSYVHEQQLLGRGLGCVRVTEKMLSDLGGSYCIEREKKSKIHKNRDYNGNIVGAYGTLVRYAPCIESQAGTVASYESFPRISGNNSFSEQSVSIASLAWGYASFKASSDNQCQ